MAARYCCSQLVLYQVSLKRVPLLRAFRSGTCAWRSLEGIRRSARLLAKLQTPLAIVSDQYFAITHTA